MLTRRTSRSKLIMKYTVVGKYRWARGQGLCVEEMTVKASMNCCNGTHVPELVLLRAFAYLTDLILMYLTNSMSFLSLRVALTLLGSSSRARQSSDAGARIAQP